jgi:hypothetical protein
MTDAFTAVSETAATKIGSSAPLLRREMCAVWQPGPRVDVPSDVPNLPSQVTSGQVCDEKNVVSD